MNIITLSKQDAGTDQSIGANQEGSKAGRLNTNYSVGYYSIERFQNPSFRIRGSLFRQVSSWFTGGLQSGFKARFHRVSSNSIKAWFAIPVQLPSLIRLQESPKMEWLIDVAAGLNLQCRKINPQNEENSGILTSAGIMLAKGRWCLRFGYEYQNDKVIFRILPEPNHALVEETIRYSKKRNLLYLSVGKFVF